MNSDTKPTLECGQVQIYTGEGKGKTTAALGLCLRAYGYGLTPVMLQFIKQFVCAEHRAAQEIGLEIVQAANKDPKEGSRELYEQARKRLKEKSCDVLVLDEVGEALRRGYLTVDMIEQLVQEKPEDIELVMTGRGLIEPLGHLADLITEMKPIKHYFDQGLLARKGIEY